MKHGVIKEKPARETTKIEQTVTTKGAKKVAKAAAILPFKNTKTKATEKSQPTVKKINLKEKTAKAAAVVSKTKTTSAKAAPVVIAAEPKVKKKKIEPAIPIQKTGKTKAATVSAIFVQKITPQTKEPETIAPAIKVHTEIQKIKSAVNVGKINAALKAIEEAQLKASKTEKTEKRKLSAAARKSQIVESKIETTVLQTKAKPKNVKQIGAAVFRGRKNRYDFQVYPLDFEFENVPAIYVISKRKTDSRKRGHHALVCIGQTDSILNELKKHTQSKCVKKHEANVISILPEQSEKKRLKIEEDLKAAHQIVCNIG